MPNDPRVLPLSLHMPGASRLVYGCMGLGGAWDDDRLTDGDLAAAHAALEAALDAGITIFDHADIYRRGKAERAMGTLFARAPSLRDRLILQSKCGIRFADAEGPKRYDLSAAHLVAGVEASLARLNTDRLDILLLHRPDPLAEPAEIAEAWWRLKAAGKARFLGVSNMDGAALVRLQATLGEPLVVDQLEMSLARRDWLDSGTCFNDPQGAGVLPWGDTLGVCERAGVQLQAWGALARGAYSGDAPADPPTLAARAEVARLAAAYGVPPEAIVIAWLLAYPLPIQPVIGTTDPSRIRACAAAGGIALGRGHWYSLYALARGRELP